MQSGTRLLSRAVLAMVLAAACTRPAPFEVPLGTEAPVILISIDTLRSDRLPAHGYTQIETPSLSALARDSVVFERAYSHTPLTLPAHVSILSGMLPDRHGVRDNLGYRVPSDLETYLPRDLKRRGFATGAAVSAFVLRRATAFADGFDFYEDDIPFREGAASGNLSRSGEASLEASLDWLRSVASEKFFFFFHIYEPHTPWEAPEPFASRYPLAYDAEVVAADAVIGRLIAELERLGIYDRASIVLLSDHGEGLGDHGEIEHGILLYREALQVPLWIKLPDQQRAGTRVTASAQLVDVYPTVAELAGWTPDGSLPGTSLLRLLENEPRERAVYAETFYPRLHLGWSDLASLIEGRFHYIHGPRPELYDLVEDPGETRDIVSREPAVVERLSRQLAAYDRGLTVPAAEDEETRRRLAALGYLASGPADLAGPLPDPKVRLPTLTDFNAAVDWRDQGEFARAAAACRRVLDANPRMVDAWELLGNSLEKIGDYEQALSAYRSALALSTARPEILLAAARLELRLGRLDEAVAGLELARSQGVANPSWFRRLGLELAERGRVDEALGLLREAAGDGSAESRNALARVLSDAGRDSEALETLSRVLAERPDNPQSHELIGLVYLRLGDHELARRHSQRAVELAPHLADGWNNLGVASYHLGQPAEAIRCWREAVDRDPSQYEALFNLGLLSLELGQPDQAQQALGRFIDTAPPEVFGRDIEQARSLLGRPSG